MRMRVLPIVNSNPRDPQGQARLPVPRVPPVRRKPGGRIVGEADAVVMSMHPGPGQDDAVECRGGRMPLQAAQQQPVPLAQELPHLFLAHLERGQRMTRDFFQAVGIQVRPVALIRITSDDLVHPGSRLYSELAASCRAAQIKVLTLR